MIWQILNIETLQSEYFEKLSDLVRKYSFTESTVRNKWTKEKKDNSNELEISIIIDKYRITKIEVQ